MPQSRPFHYGGEDCLSAAPVLPVLLVLPVLPVLSEAEGSVAKRLSISDRPLTKSRFFTAFRMTTFGFSEGHARAPLVLGSFAETKGLS